MSLQAVLLPLFVQVALTFALLLSTGASRRSVLLRGEAKLKDIALGQQNWPDGPTKLGNAFNNQLQTPVLFYVLVLLALYAHKADLVFVVLSWLFVLLRIAHAAIHVTSNFVPNRFRVFVAATTVLMVMWIIVAVRILFSI